jgi:hypothetical protein
VKDTEQPSPVKASAPPSINSVGQVHIITPFHRPQNASALIAHLEPMRVIWHPICDVHVEFDAPWIVPLYVVLPPGRLILHQKHNYWIETQPIVDSDWYGFMNDDDGYEPNVMDMVRSKTTSQVVVISMKRGDRTPPGTPPGSAHDIYTLRAAPEEMRVCYAGVEQLFVRGSVLRTLRFVDDNCGDGLMMEYVTRRFPTTYEPNYYALFNVLEAGRWDTEPGAAPAQSDRARPDRPLRNVRYLLLRTWIGLRVWFRQFRARPAIIASSGAPIRADGRGSTSTQKANLGAR